MLQLSFLYIDEGPYMPSLEHLVQHYMHFSDGLPINLRYSVPPKPKPPLPLFSTIPRKEHKKIAPLPVVDKLSSKKDHRAISSLELNVTTKYPPQRNMSIPSDDLMNTVGISSSPPDSKNKGKDKDLLKFRSLKLKSPKKRNIIIDGMKSLKKNKAKVAAPETPAKNELEEIAPAWKNLSFSTDLKLADPGLYNVPTNNSAVEEFPSRTPRDLQHRSVSQLDNQNNNSSITQDYFVAGDNTIHSDHDKGSEEIYFIDAPTMTKTDLPSTSFQYVPFKHVPYFPDGSPPPINNNNPMETMPSNDPRFNRLESTTSTCSMDSEYFAQHKHIIDSRIATPNYFIPKSNLQLNEVLGEGEFGSVYKGILRLEKDNKNYDETNVAIKTLHDEQQSKQNRAEFLREASVMIKLSHHCIVKLIGISKVCCLKFEKKYSSLRIVN